MKLQVLSRLGSAGLARTIAAAVGASSLAAVLFVSAAGSSPQQGSDEASLRKALDGHFAALSKGDLEKAWAWLTPDYFYIAPWGTMEFGSEEQTRYKQAFTSGTLKNYHIEMRDLHSGPAGDGARWFRAIVREKYLRESGRMARNAFAEDLLTTGIGVRQKDGTWRIRFLHQTWSDETLRRMVPILHAAQPVDPEEY